MPADYPEQCEAGDGKSSLQFGRQVGRGRTRRGREGLEKVGARHDSNDFTRIRIHYRNLPPIVLDHLALQMLKRIGRGHGQIPDIHHLRHRLVPHPVRHGAIDGPPGQQSGNPAGAHDRITLVPEALHPLCSHADRR